MNISERVRAIASDVLTIEPGLLTDESSPEDFDAWDSVQHLSLVLALEEQFRVQFEPEEIDRMRTIGGIVRIIEGRMNGGMSRDGDRDQAV
jgi:acyl carrier protein